jgi:putative glutamine amidotransferase
MTKTAENRAPLIGVTTYGRNEENKFESAGQYVDAVRRAGGIPLLLPPGEQRWHECFASLHGLLLTGGGDLDPQHYGGCNHETIYMVDRERDAGELALARLAVEVGLPTLGICRGAQVINVALGGTLFEHLPDAVGNAVLHRAPPREPVHHPIVVQPDSRLAAIFQQLELTCVSWHHQGLRDVAAGLTVTAHAPDGAIEAIEMRTHSWLVGVQWHPELSAAEEPAQQRLFDALVEAATGWRARV